MNFIAIMTAIGIWCGQPSNVSQVDHWWQFSKPYTMQDVQRCRDLMVECAILRSKDLALDFDTVVACFRSMSFGEFREPKQEGKP